jgi:hypothetical protein
MLTPLPCQRVGGEDGDHDQRHEPPRHPLILCQSDLSVAELAPDRSAIELDKERGPIFLSEGTRDVSLSSGVFSLKHSSRLEAQLLAASQFDFSFTAKSYDISALGGRMPVLHKARRKPDKIRARDFDRVGLIPGERTIECELHIDLLGVGATVGTRVKAHRTNGVGSLRRRDDEIAMTIPDRDTHDGNRADH